MEPVSTFNIILIRNKKKTILIRNKKKAWSKAFWACFITFLIRNIYKKIIPVDQLWEWKLLKHATWRDVSKVVDLSLENKKFQVMTMHVSPDLRLLLHKGTTVFFFDPDYLKDIIGGLETYSKKIVKNFRFWFFNC